jgi:hypothetical protein
MDAILAAKRKELAEIEAQERRESDAERVEREREEPDPADDAGVPAHAGGRSDEDDF